jgi:capsule polysaccharide export protein KpsE/RkpR
MDQHFIEKLVEKLQANLAGVTNQLIMTDTHLDIANEKIEALSTEVERLTKQIARSKKSK